MGKIELLHFIGGHMEKSQLLSRIKYKSTIITIIFIALMIMLIAFDIKSPSEKTSINSIYYKPITHNSFNLDDDWTLMDSTRMPRPDNIADKYALKLNLELSETKMLYLSQVYGYSFEVLDKDMNLIYKFDEHKGVKNYGFLYDMSYIPVSSDTVYLVISTTKGIPHIGISSDSGIYNLDILNPAFDSRKAIGLILIILSLITMVMSEILKSISSERYLINTSYFIGIYGIWSLFDFYRHSFWIHSTLSFVPMPILIIIYIISANMMAPYFIKLNMSLIKNLKYKLHIRYLFYLISIIALTGISFETLRMFYWNTTLNTAYQYYFAVYAFVVSIGSLVLIIYAWLDYKRGDMKALIYAVGLTGCLITFTISQSTEYLISHWGVLWLLFAIILVMSVTFLETQEKSNQYLSKVESMNLSMTALYDDIKYTQKELLLRLGSTVDLKSKETSLHVHRVSALTEFIAKKMKYTDEEAQMIALASTLHDIGKVGIPDRILNEPGKLTTQDFNTMKGHSKMGYEILNGSNNQLMDYAAIIALTHHERFDGTGYPDRLSGNDIPLIGAIVAAADVFDALLSKRVYKPAWSFEQVYEYFKEQNGRHFNPKVVDVIISNYDDIVSIAKKEL